MDKEILPLTNIDSLYLKLKALPEANMPLTHIFTPGLYTRQIFMPAGAIVISKIHKFEHPFLVSKGRVSVIDSHGNCVMIQAPYLGVTKPGTQRVLYCHSDTLWATFHVTDLTDPEEIVNQITYPPDNNSITIADNTMKMLQEGSL